MYGLAFNGCGAARNQQFFLYEVKIYFLFLYQGPDSPADPAHPAAPPHLRAEEVQGVGLFAREEGDCGQARLQGGRHQGRLDGSLRQFTAVYGSLRQFSALALTAFELLEGCLTKIIPPLQSLHFQICDVDGKNGTDLPNDSSSKCGGQSNL